MAKRYRRWKCEYCHRNLCDPVAHRCKGTMRKRNLKFTDRCTFPKLPELNIGVPPVLVALQNMKRFLAASGIPGKYL